MIDAVLLIEIVGVASSSVIVRRPVASVVPAPVAPLNVIVAVSLSSSKLSLAIVTENVLLDSPALNVSVPDTAV